MKHGESYYITQISDLLPFVSLVFFLKYYLICIFAFGTVFLLVPLPKQLHVLSDLKIVFMLPCIRVNLQKMKDFGLFFANIYTTKFDLFLFKSQLRIINNNKHFI